MPQAEHILEKVALNEVSALPWRWTLRDEDEWTAEFQILDDDGMEHEVRIVFLNEIFFNNEERITPQTELTPELVKALKTRLDIPAKLLTDTPSGQVGSKGLSVYTVAFFVDNYFRKNMDMNLSFAKVALRLFTTVAAVIRAFVKEIQPDVLNWSPVTNSRGAIYNKMMKREKVPGYVGWSGTDHSGYLRRDSLLAR